MTSAYDPEYVSHYYDNYGEREWVRLTSSPANKVSFHLHRHYLQRYVTLGDHALEAGAGPGRFTIELAKLGAVVTVGDISPRQLEINLAKVQEAGYEANVLAREVLDVVDLSRFATGSFDVAVCYGGALSYVFDRADNALEELLRVTRPGGYVLLSVMSLLGSTQAFLAGVLDVARQRGLAAVQQVNETGDLTGDIAGGHRCHMFRWAELEALLRRHHCTIVAASASNCLSLMNDRVLSEIESEPDLWEAILQWEVDFCKEAGALDGGTHIIAVVQR